MNPLFKNDNELKKQYPIIAGIDEAGRGPLFGPVVVASVILKDDFEHHQINDSKKLTEAKREFLYDEILLNAVCYHIEVISPQIIDSINILQASLLGMRVCAENLQIKPSLCLIDGNHLPTKMPYPSQAVIKGDGLHACIAAASILAKVTRDRIMVEMDAKYPGYGFAHNKGYPTKEHLEAIERLGVLPDHRQTYGPISQLTFKFNNFIDSNQK
jgi:ribonuclease HII